MNDLIADFVPVSRDAMVPVLDLAFKATALLLLTWVLHFLAGRRRALLRSALWNACLVALLLVPVACLALPRLLLPVLPTPVSVTPGPDEGRTSFESKPDSGHSEFRADAPSVRTSMPGQSRRTEVPDFETGAARSAAVQTASNPMPERGWRLDLVRAGIGLYLAVALVLMLRLGASLLAIRRLKQNCISIDETVWIEGLARASFRLRITRPVRLLCSDRISVPIVAGWNRPAVILPVPLAGPAGRDLVDAVLLHELAHIRRGDFLWNVIRKLVQALYWPHPLAWPLGRVIGSVREQACDDLCVHVLGGPDVYHDSLVEVAAGLVRRPEPALGMAMARSTALARRIAWIHRTRGASDCILPRPARMAVAVSMVSLAGLIGSVELARASAEPAQGAKAERQVSKDEVKTDSKPESQPISEVPKSIVFSVVANDTGKPLANASISAYVDRKMEFHRTDGNGRARIDLTGRAFLDIMSFDVYVEGYVQQRFAYSKYESDKPPLPAQIQVNLWPGEETLGGKVVDEQGQPVAGAKVKIWGYLGEKKDSHELAYLVDCTTDVQGQWRCRSFRKMTWAYLYLSHPDFLPDTDQNPRVHGRIVANGEPTPNEQPFQGLRDFTDVEVLKKGIRIAGRVVDEAGKPVAGAEIGWIRVLTPTLLQLDVQKATADADGHFELPQTRPGQVVLQFKAPGHATETKVVKAKEGMAPLTFTIGRPYVMTGRVVDSKGGPIAGCEVLVDPWRGYGGPGFYLKTDAEGRFRWGEAPAEGVLIRLGREGFESVDRYRVDPSAGEAIVALKRALQITGSILDAETGQKILERGEVEVGKRNLMTGQFEWTTVQSALPSARQVRVTAMDGKLRANLDAEAVSEYRLRVRVNGYRPSEPRVFRRDAGSVAWEVRLTKAAESKKVDVKGIVKRPDGKPLEGADVALAVFAANGTVNGGNLQRVQVRDGKIERIRNQNVVKTDTEGRFALKHEVDADSKPSLLVIVHPDFYAEVPQADFEEGAGIVARPWGRIEGVARLRDRRAGDAKIQYYNSRITNAGEPYVSFSGELKTDADGKFVIQRVLPGELQVIHVQPDPTTRNLWYASTLVKVKSGETARVEMGGKGRPVIARIERPTGFDPDLDYAANSECYITSDRPRVPRTKDLFGRVDESNRKMIERWWDTPEGFEYRRNWMEFVASIQRDGTIRVEEVPPGDYELRLTYSGEPFRGRDILPVNVGYVTLKFTVPDIPGGYTDEPLDLGTLKPLPKPDSKVGQPVPEFDAETLDGKRLKLKDLRGKFVLLDFWATWCGPCVDEIPEMKAVFEKYRNDDRFAMVSLSIDAEKDAPLKFVTEKGLDWHQGWLGAWAAGGVQDAFHVEAIPAVFLIGPDGRLISKDLRGKAMAAAVARALEGK